MFPFLISKEQKWMHYFLVQPLNITPSVLKTFKNCSKLTLDFCALKKIYIFIFAETNSFSTKPADTLGAARDKPLHRPVVRKQTHLPPRVVKMMT